MIPEDKAKVLVAPSKEEYESVKQHIDFNYVDEGDYLLLGFACDCWRHPSDWIERGGKERIVTRCGCDRSFTGLNGKGCTVGKVVPMPYEKFADLRRKLEKSEFYMGWSRFMSLEDFILAAVKPIVQSIQQFDDGDLVMIETISEESVEIFTVGKSPIRDS